MKKTIHRRIDLTPDEVLEAVCLWLREHDHPTPRSSDPQIKVSHQSFCMTKDGAVLSWQEETEQKL